MLELTTFSGLTLSRDGAPVTGAAAQRSRLAVLVLIAAAGPAGISRDKLMALLWPDSDSDRARHSLNQALYAIRKELGLSQSDFGAGVTSLSVGSDVMSADFMKFDRAIASGDLESAVALYTGPFLDGVYLREAPEFERWSSDQRARLAHDWSVAVEKLARGAEAVADWKGAIGLWRKLATSEPMNSAHAVALMRALAESGDAAGALQHARIHEAMIREELSAEPDAEVTALADALRSGTWTRSVMPPSPPSTTTRPVVAKVIEATANVSLPGPQPRRRALRIGAFAALAAALVLMTAYAAVPRDLRAAALTLLTRPDARLDSSRIVVAPFENHTGSAEMDAVGELAADWVAMGLQEANLQVVDQRTTAVTSRIVGRIPRLLRPRSDAIAIARETGARVLVAGRYYRQGDSLEFNVTLSDAGDGHVLRSVPPVKGLASAPETLVAAVASKTTAAIVAALDQSVAAPTAALAHPPSLEAYEHVTNAWQTFFARPFDTAAVFAELGRAIEIDSSYAAPYLMKGYILTVKANWPELATTLKRLDAKKPQLTPPERAARDLLQADLRGDLRGRLRASRELMRLSPGSAELVLLVAVSASYLGRFDEALAALERTDPRRGMNLVTPMYWAWRSADEHEAGHTLREMWSVDNGMHQFPTSASSNYSRVRSLAARGKVRDVERAIERGPLDPADPAGDRQELTLMAVRELRTHGYTVEARTMAARLATELAAATSSASRTLRTRRASALYEAGDYASTIAVCRELLATDSSDVDALGRLGTAARRAGDVKTASAVDAKLASMTRPYDFGRSIAWRARLAAVDGRVDESVQLLRSAVDRGFRLMDLGDVTIHQDPDLASVASSPAFNVFMRGLREEREP